MGNKLAKIRQDTLSPAYIYEFGAPVWRIKPDSATGSLALEVRDGDVLQTSFFSLNCPDFTLTQLHLPQQQLWWQGLEDAQEGLVILHGYGDRKLGQHKGITVVSAAGAAQWANPELAFYGIGANGMYVFEVATPESGFLLLELHTGLVKSTGISQADAAEEVAKFNGVRNNNISYPVFYQEGEAYFDTVQVFLNEALGVTPVQAIEYAETNNSIIISFYERDGESKLKNDVAVFDVEGNFYLRETLADGLNGIGSDTFFIFREYLFFIRNKSVLQAFLLSAL